MSSSIPGYHMIHCVSGLQLRVRNENLIFLFLNQNICCGVLIKVSKSVLPSYVNEMFYFRPFNETLQSLRSTGALDFYTPRPQKEIFKQSLIYSGPVIWKNLPDCLKNLETVDSFHRHCIKWMKSSLTLNL